MGGLFLCSVVGVPPSGEHVLEGASWCTDVMHKYLRLSVQQ